jgi:hypothetical protein
MRHIGSPGGEKQLHDIIQEIIYKSCRSMFQKATLGPPLTEAAACEHYKLPKKNLQQRSGNFLSLYWTGAKTSHA